MNSTYEQTTLTVGLETQAHQLAHAFAQEQWSASRRRQVYLNTLAVWAVHHWLSWLSIPSLLEESLSWKADERLVGNLADLYLPGFGRLECHPVVTDQADTWVLPPEALEDRCGYLAIQFDAGLTEAVILGFSEAPQGNRLRLDGLAAPEELFTHLESLTLSSRLSSTLIDLQRWFDVTANDLWQPLEQLLGSPALAFRGLEGMAVQRGRRIAGERFGLASDLLMSVAVSAGPIYQVEVSMGMLDGTALPAGVEMAILDGDDEPVYDQSGGVLAIISTSGDERVQLHMTGEAGDQFSVHLVYEEVCISEEFQL